MQATDLEGIEVDDVDEDGTQTTDNVTTVNRNKVSERS